MAMSNDVPEIGWIRKKVNVADYFISEHVIRYFLAGTVTIPEIEDAIANGTVIEIHRNPERDACSLVYGHSGETPIHVMCADSRNGCLLILYAYAPSKPTWDDPINRAKQGDPRMEEKLNTCFFCGSKIKQIIAGNFDYRLEGQLYVVKRIPAGLCVQCGEKYITAQVSKKINSLIEERKFADTEDVFVLEYD